MPRGGNGNGTNLLRSSSDVPELSAGKAFRKRAESMAQKGIHIVKTQASKFGEVTNQNGIRTYEYFANGFNIKYMESDINGANLRMSYSGKEFFSASMSSTKITDVEICSSNPKFMGLLNKLYASTNPEVPTGLIT